LFDIVNTPGVASDLSHISTPAKVEGFLPPNDGLKNALTGADVVVIPAGVPRKPGVSLLYQPVISYLIRLSQMTRSVQQFIRVILASIDHLSGMISSRHVFGVPERHIPLLITISRQINAGIIRDLATGIATTCPKAFILVISNPVNSTVPVVAEVLKKHDVFDPKKYALDLSL
jgi:malate dehydrogenase